MFPSIEDLMKAQAEAFKASNTVATTAFEGAKKLLELNVQAAKAGMEESNAQLKALMAAKDVKTLNDMLTDLFTQYSKPDTSKAVAYVKQVYDISTATERRGFRADREAGRPQARSSCWNRSTPWQRTPPRARKARSMRSSRAWSPPTPRTSRSMPPASRCSR